MFESWFAMRSNRDLFHRTLLQKCGRDNNCSLFFVQMSRELTNIQTKVLYPASWPAYTSTFACFTSVFLFFTMFVGFESVWSPFWGTWEKINICHVTNNILYLFIFMTRHRGTYAGFGNFWETALTLYGPVLLMRAASITRTSGRGLGPGNRDLLGSVKGLRADRQLS